MISPINESPLWLRLAISLGLMSVLLTLSLIPGEADESDSVFIWAVALTPTPLQKLMHLLLYGLLAFLWAWTLEALESVATRFLVAALLAASFGAVMEFAQTHIPGRFGSLADVLLNGTGAALGLAVAWLLL